MNSHRERNIFHKLQFYTDESSSLRAVCTSYYCSTENHKAVHVHELLWHRESQCDGRMKKKKRNEKWSSKQSDKIGRKKILHRCLFIPDKRYVTVFDLRIIFFNSTHAHKKSRFSTHYFINYLTLIALNECIFMSSFITFFFFSDWLIYSPKITTLYRLKAEKEHFIEVNDDFLVILSFIPLKSCTTKYFTPFQLVFSHERQNIHSEWFAFM